MKNMKRLNRAICIAFFPFVALAGNAFADSDAGSASAGNSSAQSAADQRAAAEAAGAAANNPPCTFIVGKGLVCD
ncbi:hypothetical protein BZK31_14205 [Pseudomonas floridensis]|uniref:Uncharacterized protein n=1 Tax=Pseudomonas floridensis TaxID=1958950 RepID=A0A1X0N5S6_9PSED|nr:hypothetical protein [Pseudomonas floridensis]ORC58647.1 hypothetical protein BZK31_14205 [Pseudomonas floridensis]